MLLTRTPHPTFSSTYPHYPQNVENLNRESILRQWLGALRASGRRTAHHRDHVGSGRV